MNTVPRIGRVFRGTIPTEELYGATPDELARLRALGYLPPLAGADGAGEAGGDGSGDGGEAGGDGDQGDGENAGGSGDGDGDGSAGESELDAARRAAAAANRELRELKAARDDADRKAAEEAGKWKELYEGAKAELDELRTEQATSAKKTLVEAAAKSTGFKNPELAYRLLSDEDRDSIEDKVDAERIVKRLAKTEPYLVEPAAPRQKRDAGENDDADTGGDGDGSKDEPVGVDRLRRAFASSGKKS